MPSLLHEGIVRLFQDCPQLAVTLLRDVVGVPLPAYTELRIESADLGDIEPAARHADLVVLLAREVPVLGIVVEAQLHVDDDKRFSWPAYATNLRARLRCDVELLVFTPDRAVAAWAMRPIPIGQGVFRPVVVGPDGLPMITDVEEARRSPELAVLCAMGHGRDEEDIAVRGALAAIVGAAGFKDRRALLYTDLVRAALNDAARVALESLMQNEGYRYQSDFARRYVSAGKAEVVLKQVQLKFGELSPDVRARVENATGEDLDLWAERILTAATLEELFG